ncbi:MAG: lipoyl synthase [Omnitrophica WOR_2 bacterium RIFCSPHIGHO2_01_FULL_48_9]|nr:MAG: lipoyl synthase [Omnitrophica WOR_2 bacterium RIFCSPHIGHO2_01_FULL_48_9]
MITVKRLPEWFRQDLPDMQKIGEMKSLFRTSRLHTVCESAHCPNMGKCWGEGIATFMILGDTCTRACRFCAVPAGKPLIVDPEEPRHVALAVKELNLSFVVVTSVARDDLEDQGAEHFAKTIAAIRSLTPQTKIEILIPDFSNRWESLKTVVAAKPEVISHNIETVRRLSAKVRPQADYDRSLKVLENFKGMDASIFSKSSLMLGLGETREEIIQVMQDLLAAECDILTIGQYLAPTEMRRHLPEERFVPPEEFDEYRRIGMELGFKHVMAGPLVRSSFLAEQGYKDCLERTSAISSQSSAKSLG